MLQDVEERNVDEDVTEGHHVRQFAMRDSQGLTYSQRGAVDKVYAGIKALQV